MDYIVSNPPFLGTKKLRSELQDEYVEALFEHYGERIPNFSDLCCYWFEKARQRLVDNGVERVGLLATQGIRGGLNREVLKRIRGSGQIFFAESDRPWILDGANVHVSIVGFDDGADTNVVLDGEEVETINSNLTSGADTSQAKKLPSNRRVAFIADVKAGQFDLSWEEAAPLLDSPNPNGRPNSDVLVPWVNGSDILGRPRGLWIIDFGVSTPLEQAAAYEAPMKRIEELVRPAREKVRREKYGELWWLHARPGHSMRREVGPLARFVGTPLVSKHRIFKWFQEPTLPDHQLAVFAHSDDTFFGILHSRIHELWALKLGTRLETRPRYTPTTCFETFPFPDATPEQEEAIAAAARELNDLREEWLNPKDWTREEILEFPGSTDGPWAKYLHDPDSNGIGTVRYPRTVPREPIPNPDDPDNPETDYAAKLAARTLTKLYNQRPTWLHLAHQTLDHAVLAAYGWDPEITDKELLEKLLALNLETSPGPEP